MKLVSYCHLLWRAMQYTFGLLCCDFDDKNWAVSWRLHETCFICSFYRTEQNSTHLVYFVVILMTESERWAEGVGGGAHQTKGEVWCQQGTQQGPLRGDQVSQETGRQGCGQGQAWWRTHWSITGKITIFLLLYCIYEFTFLFLNYFACVVTKKPVCKVQTINYLVLSVGSKSPQWIKISMFQFWYIYSVRNGIKEYTYKDKVLKANKWVGKEILLQII